MLIARDNLEAVTFWHITSNRQGQHIRCIAHGTYYDWDVYVIDVRLYSFGQNDIELSIVVMKRYETCKYMKKTVFEDFEFWQTNIWRRLKHAECGK